MRACSAHPPPVFPLAPLARRCLLTPAAKAQLRQTKAREQLTTSRPQQPGARHASCRCARCFSRLSSNTALSPPSLADLPEELLREVFGHLLKQADTSWQARTPMGPACSVLRIAITLASVSRL